jgi:hypothetical protein
MQVEELVWRKPGGERCPRTEKKALAAEPVVPVPVPVQVPALAIDGFHKANNKREEANHKLNDRYLVGQAKQNPFMPNSNFIDDLEVQLNFLTPQKSI